jgi:hypothetical protein
MIRKIDQQLSFKDIKYYLPSIIGLVGLKHQHPSNLISNPILA